eukprot:CAMPEP_0114139350 /NCGR_PEP_ID=MMETSP0043_2-20121206/16806_1 /TAXON_ID=464988 /ORGANISM="Hemiselmis andersenii, Strain CCMP644" /LENGTH=106 /DNA_ID=CAMNT_0001233375 /DNA_START=245 /DNA_END=565 /DNA_ORIENTATION=+
MGPYVPPRPQNRHHCGRHGPPQPLQEPPQGGEAPQIVLDLRVVNLQNEGLPTAVGLPLLRRVHVLQEGHLEAPSQAHNLFENLMVVVLQGLEVWELGGVEEWPWTH